VSDASSPKPLRVVIFGATGTVGAGALLECLDSSAVARVLSIVRKPSGKSHPKLSEIVHGDFSDFTSLASAFSELDACFWCIGAPSSGLTEQRYTEITVDTTLAAARVLLEQSPELCFVFVSGVGSDETEQSKTMWARVKGKAENAILGMGFRDAVAFRPGMIVPRRGLRHNVTLYRWSTYFMFPVLPLLRALGMATSTVEIGRAMIAAALGERVGEPPLRRLTSKEINELARRAP
jgi:uncharacterized protein YbjT (DUF2867 family)